MNDALAVPMFGIFADKPVAGYSPPPVSSQLRSDDLERYEQLLGMIGK